MTVKETQKYNITADELNRMYNHEGKSQQEIANIYGMKTHKTVSMYMKKFGIKARGKSEALIAHHNGLYSHTPLTKRELEIILGETLGDGCLQIDKRNTGESTPYYRHSSKYKEYLEWLPSALFSLKWKEVTETKHNYIKKDGTVLTSFNLRSLCHPDLKSIYNDFYDIIDGNPIKHIPYGIRLTPLMLRHWFLGDGTAGLFSTGKDKNGNKKLSWQMTIYTCSFSKEELEIIILPQLVGMGIIATITMKPGRHRLRISAKSFDRFYEVIGSCPVDCYSYKWGYLDLVKHQKAGKTLQEAQQLLLKSYKDTER